jgi:tetratricopeptide (TPR) repeat protein
MSTGAGYAQSALLNLPRDSQRAEVVQRIGITDVTILYHRPEVKGREVWGKLVPYGQVWRAGANENTIIEFTDPVTIEGKALAAGKYGLQMIPNKDEFTVIFSKANESWGSFSYKEAEDALRVSVKPQATEMHEALTYDFDQLTPDSAVVTMRWDKVAVPFKVGVNVHEVVAASLPTQLRGLAQYTWDGWDDAGNYLLAQKYDLDDALRYENRSIQVEDRFDNEMSKAKVLDAMGKTDDANMARTKALAMATPLQKHVYGVQLLGEKKRDQAFSIFQQNAKDHPDMWFVHMGMARVYSSQGNFDGAVKEMKLAQAGAPEGNQPAITMFLKRLEAKNDITR